MLFDNDGSNNWSLEKDFAILTTFFLKIINIIFYWGGTWVHDGTQSQFLEPENASPYMIFIYFRLISKENLKTMLSIIFVNKKVLIKFM